MLQGQISKYQLFGVYTQLARQKSGGTLILRNRKHNSALYFSEGKIIFATANVRRVRLGEILVRNGRIDRNQLEEALNLQRSSSEKIRIGRILIQHFNLDPDALIEGIQEQIITIVEDLFEWSIMNYQFLEKVYPSNEKITVDISVENVILKEARKIDSWDIIKNELPDLTSILQISKATDGYVRNVQLLSEEWNVFRLIDGRITIKEICQTSNQSEFEVCKILYRLMSAGLIEKVPIPSYSKLSNLEKKMDRLTRLLSINLKDNNIEQDTDLVDFGD